MSTSFQWPVVVCCLLFIVCCYLLFACYLTGKCVTVIISTVTFLFCFNDVPDTCGPFIFLQRGESALHVLAGRVKSTEIINDEVKIANLLLDKGGNLALETYQVKFESVFVFQH